MVAEIGPESWRNFNSIDLGSTCELFDGFGAARNFTPEVFFKIFVLVFFYFKKYHEIGIELFRLFDHV